MKAFVLAGGLGTRLKPALGDVPKPLAPVAGRPFVAHVLAWLAEQGVREAVMCAGHGADRLRAGLGERAGDVALHWSIEEQPLGTGGALAHAARFVDGPAVVVNGDTLARCGVWALERARWRRGALGAIALYRVADAASRGRVECQGPRVAGFVEKDPAHVGPAWVNGGVYAFAPRLWARFPRAADGAALPCSLERELLPALAAEDQLAGLEVEGEFLDIGTPESWAEAGRRLAG
jgi:D-glycero-alpha-D-manno-heptose 1-phosphate guanylyltransferase